MIAGAFFLRIRFVYAGACLKIHKIMLTKIFYCSRMN